MAYVFNKMDEIFGLQPEGDNSGVINRNVGAGLGAGPAPSDQVGGMQEPVGQQQSAKATLAANRSAQVPGNIYGTQLGQIEQSKQQIGKKPMTICVGTALAK